MIKFEERKLEEKNHRLRNSGMIPGVMCGPDIADKAIKMNHLDLKRTLEKSGEVYEVTSKNRKVFVKFHEVQRDPVSKSPIHFTLVQLPKGVKNEIDIPINLLGKPKGMEDGGVLIQLLNELRINCEPKKVPSEITTNIKELTIGDSISVRDLELPQSLEVLNDPDEVVAVCRPPAKSAVGEEADSSETTELNSTEVSEAI